MVHSPVKRRKSVVLEMALWCLSSDSALSNIRTLGTFHYKSEHSVLISNAGETGTLVKYKIPFGPTSREFLLQARSTNGSKLSGQKLGEKQDTRVISEYLPQGM